MPNSIGAPLSAHKRGMAADLVFQKIDFFELQKDIIDNYENVYRDWGLTVIEKNTVTWLHFSVEWVKGSHLFTIPFYK